MRRTHPTREEPIPLRPVGVALAAVVAGLSAGKATPAQASAKGGTLEPATREKTFVVDHTNHPSFEEDPNMVVDRSEPVEPLRDAAQQDLFKD